MRALIHGFTCVETRDRNHARNEIHSAVDIRRGRDTSTTPPLRRSWLDGKSYICHVWCYAARTIVSWIRQRVRVRDAGAPPHVCESRVHRRIDATYSTAATSTLRYVETRNKFQTRNWKDSANSRLLFAASSRLRIRPPTISCVRAEHSRKKR